ncbi:MAG: hypothetical protein ABEJ93_03400 [Candidatus Nanohalobium sp.]
MEVELVSVKENPLMERREAEAKISHEGEPTPSKEDISDRLAAENGLNTDEIEIETVYTGYGKNTSKASMKIYQDFDYDEDLEEESIEEEPAEVTQEVEEIVSGTITEAKEKIKEAEDIDVKAVLQAEKENKDRKTLKQWLEDKISS